MLWLDNTHQQFCCREGISTFTYALCSFIYLLYMYVRVIVHVSRMVMLSQLEHICDVLGYPVFRGLMNLSTDIVTCCHCVFSAVFLGMYAVLSVNQLISTQYTFHVPTKSRVQLVHTYVHAYVCIFSHTYVSIYVTLCYLSILILYVGGP